MTRTADQHRRPSAAGEGSPRHTDRPPADDRYELEELLGRGGMGDVYAATETRLGRRVALKLLRGDDPEQVARFLREARAQAGIDHPNVCKVYETGELDGRPYIAMEYVAGEPLSVAEGASGRPTAATFGMPLEQKLQVMEQVAWGIHAAHRRGVIHRDVKPSNVMVERRDDGSWKATVLDFGLAREVAGQAVTSLGLAVGTPNFMAPEQVRGDSRALDRRTDVYGLGATLYALLAGRAPFEGASSLDVMVKVTEDELPPLKGVPVDVATIVAKCLEKDPARRYDSAKALAEDLRRYLDGEPVAARRTSLGYRLWKRAQKNRRSVAAAAVALSALMTLGAFSVRAELRARQQAQLARELGQQVTGMGNLMRIAEMLPRHDINAERQRIRELMAQLAARVRRLGEIARGPGAYALGRGYLALGEPEEARAKLEAAWQEGYQEPGVAYALGLALGELYRKELLAAGRIRDEEEREARKREIAARLRDPALRYLASARLVEVESPTFVEALVAFYDERYDQALELSRRAFAETPWLHEAARLQGDVLVQMAAERWNGGEADAAFQTLAAARDAYRAAAEVGRSDAAAYEGLCDLATRLLEMRMYGRGGDLERSFAEGLESCKLALAIDPQSKQAYRALSGLYFRRGEQLLRQGADPEEALRNAIDTSGKLLELEPENSHASYHIGVAYSLLAQRETKLGQDPRPTLAASNRALERIADAGENRSNALNALGINGYLEALYLLDHGGDPRPLVERSLARFREIWEDDDIRLYARANAGNALAARAQYELRNGLDPTPALDAGVAALREAIELSPDYANGHTGIAYLARIRAEYALAAGLDPTPALEEDEAAVSAILALNPDSLAGWLHRGRLEILRARHLLTSGSSPLAALAAARRALVKSIEIGGEQESQIRTALAEAAVVEARWRISRGEAPLTTIAGGLRWVDEATGVNPRDVEALRHGAELHLQRADWRHRHGATDADDLGQGLAAADRALDIDPNRAEVLAVRGSLHLRRGEQAPHAADRERELAAARADLDRALAINRRLERSYGEVVERLAELTSKG